MGYECDECDEPITDTRYYCIEAGCENIDFCDDCVAKARKTIHQDHRLIPVEPDGPKDKQKSTSKSQAAQHSTTSHPPPPFQGQRQTRSKVAQADVAVNQKSADDCAGYRCDGCNEYLSGTNYCCETCDDVDFCEDCVDAAKRGAHKTHKIVLVKDEVDDESTQPVQQEVQQQSKKKKGTAKKVSKVRASHPAAAPEPVVQASQQEQEPSLLVDPASQPQQQPQSNEPAPTFSSAQTPPSAQQPATETPEVDYRCSLCKASMTKINKETGDDKGQRRIGDTGTGDVRMGEHAYHRIISLSRLGTYEGQNQTKLAEAARYTTVNIPQSLVHLEKAQLFYGHANSHKTNIDAPFVVQLKLVSDFKMANYNRYDLLAARHRVIDTGILLEETTKTLSSQAEEEYWKDPARVRGYYKPVPMGEMPMGAREVMAPDLAAEELRMAVLEVEKEGHEGLGGLKALMGKLKVPLEKVKKDGNGGGDLELSDSE